MVNLAVVIGIDSFSTLHTTYLAGCAIKPVNRYRSAPFESLQNWRPRRDWMIDAGIVDVGRPILPLLTEREECVAVPAPDNDEIPTSKK